MQRLSEDTLRDGAGMCFDSTCLSNVDCCCQCHSHEANIVFDDGIPASFVCGERLRNELIEPARWISWPSVALFGSGVFNDGRDDMGDYGTTH